MPALLVALGLFGVRPARYAPLGVRARPRLRRARRGDLGGAARVGGRPGRRRARDGAARPTPTRRRAATSSARPSGSGSSASSRRRSWQRSARHRARVGDLAQRAAAAALPPVDELRDRAAVRAGQRRHRDRRRLPRAGVHARRSRSASCSATSSASRSASSAAPGCVTRLSRGRLRPPVGWAAVAGGGTIAGIGFTVSLLIATLAFDGEQLEEAKLGILGAALGASLVTWLAVPRDASCSPSAARTARCSARPSRSSTSPSPVDPERDHIRGPIDAPVTLVEYGDFECPYCGQAEPVVRELLADFGDVRYVWRHLPLNDVHPHAQLAAEAAEAAAEQGAFWEMHDLLLDAPGRAAPERPGRATPSSSASTSSASRATSASTPAPPGSPRTSTAPTSAASPARRPSSSTAAGTTAPTTSRRSRRPCALRARSATLATA